jgi:hypothetical protein
MDWTKAPKKKIRLSKGLNLAWVDLSTMDLAVVRKLANTCGSRLRSRFSAASDIP